MGLLDAFKQYIKDASPGGLLNSEWTPENVRMAGEAASMMPNPAGDIASGLLAVDDVRKGNYGDAVLNGLGLFPFVPALASMIKAKEPFTFLKNTQKSPNMGAMYGQDIEPAGRYLLEDTSNAAKKLPDGWVSGTHTFNNPMFIEWGAGGYADADNWKQVLSNKYGGKKGKALSKAIAKDGYDGIVTLQKGETSEIVDLTHLFK